jgi:hypothetical protein
LPERSSQLSERPRTTIAAEKRLVLVGHRRDEHCDELQRVLSRMGYTDDVARVSLEMLPDAPLVWRPGQSMKFGVVEIPQGRASGLYRRPGAVDATAYEPRYGRFVAAESSDAFHGALEALGVCWVTSPSDLTRAEYKLVQLQAANSLGIQYPDTVVTNIGSDSQPGESPEFVVKPVRYGLLATTPTPAVAYAQAIGSDDLDGLTGCPVIVQSRINAAWHLRVTTVGSDAFVAGLPAPLDVDWRRELENHARFRVNDLPTSDDIAKAAVRLAESLHLGFSSQDWIISRDDQRFFLEANPNGQWLFLDHLFRGGLTSTLAQNLIHLSSAGT